MPSLTSPGVSINANSNIGVSGNINTSYFPPSYVTSSGSIGSSSMRPTSSDLPNIVMTGYDENAYAVTMKLSPEANISPTDCMKIIMLSLAVMGGTGGFNPLAYVKKHNLERHFKYS